ncbi:hypothetical protein GF412_00490 [Candidatus Micrarchaeota archaeon]|nr:hypothetical protein [Candidatus Micrarchaeota archaeon]
MSAKDRSRKTRKKEAKPPELPQGRKLEKRSIRDEGPAKRHAKITPPKKRRASKAAAWIAGGALAIGAMLSPSKSEAKTMPREPYTEPEVKDIGSYNLNVHGGYSPFKEGETVSSLLSSMEAETKKYRAKGSPGSFSIPLEAGRKLFLKHSPSSKALFCAVTPSIDERVARLNLDIVSFSLDYSHIDIENPEMRIKNTKSSVIVSLLDSGTGRHARITIPKSDPKPSDINLVLFEENAQVNLAEQAFFALNALPASHLPENDASKAFASAMESAEFLLEFRSRNMQFSRSPTWENDPFEETIDTFIELYSSFGGDVLDKLSEETEGMNREQKSELAKLAIPRLTAIVLRPYAAWRKLEILNELDRLISSPDFSKEELQKFAWKHGLSAQYRDLMNDITREFSK